MKKDKKSINFFWVIALLVFVVMVFSSNIPEESFEIPEEKSFFDVTGQSILDMFEEAAMEEDSFTAITAQAFLDIFGNMVYESSYEGRVTCRDTDGGIKYRIWGYIYGRNRWGRRYNKSDSCLSGDYRGYVKERYCDGNTPKAKKHECPYGCAKGACKPKPVPEECTCTDSDGGKNYGVLGTVTRECIVKGEFPTSSIVLYKDECAYCTGLAPEPATCGAVKEYYCEGTEIMSEEYVCPNGCEDGACLKRCAGEEGMCGGIAGIECCSGLRCQLDGDYPDASGTCISTIRCTDSDGGKDYYVGGSVNRCYDDPTLACEVMPDKCEDSSTLKEYYCEGRSVAYETYACPYGCENRGEDGSVCICQADCTCTNTEITCVANETICTDSDGGKDYYESGTGTGLKGLDKKKGFIYGEDPNKISVRGDETLDYSIFHDHCFDSKTYNQLNEAYCDDGILMSIGYQCPNGCQDGACIRETGVWIEINGNWEISDDSRSVKTIDYGYGGHPIIIKTQGPYEHIEVKTNAVFQTKQDKGYESGICARMSKDGKGYCLSYGWGGGSSVMLSYFSGYPYNPTHLKEGPNLSINPGETFVLNLRTAGNSIKGRIYKVNTIPPDWQVIVNDSKYTSGYAGFYTYYTNTTFPWLTYKEIPYNETPKCTDSDGGRNYYVKGTTVGSSPSSNYPSVITATDCCGDYDGNCCTDCNVNKLYEFSCFYTTNPVDDTYGYYFGSEYYMCPYGCSDGACLNATIKCYDNEDCPTTLGESYCKNASDACTKVTSYRCQYPGTPESKCVISGAGVGCKYCPYGCSNGGCNEVQEPSMSLADYPSPFVVNGQLNALLVVGGSSMAEDVLASVDIISGMPLSNPTVGSAVLDSEVADIEAQNLISVGGPCSNTVSAYIMGNPANCLEGFEPGKALIKLYEHADGKFLLLVAGYSGMDTRKAGKVLGVYEDYTILGDCGTEVIVSGPSLTNIAVSCRTSGGGGGGYN